MSARIPVDSFVLVAAFRYALGRRSAGVGAIADSLVEHAGRLADWERAQIVRDIRDAVRRGFAGDQCDVEDWLRVARAMGEA